MTFHSTSHSSAVAGARSACLFQVLPKLAGWVRVVAVCDPVPVLTTATLPRRISAHRPSIRCGRYCVRKPMAAALVATPPSSHHAVSCLLSAHGVHHLVETPMCDTLQQARDMVAQAERHGVVFRVAEQFWRDPSICWRPIDGRG